VRLCAGKSKNKNKKLQTFFCGSCFENALYFNNYLLADRRENYFDNRSKLQTSPGYGTAN